MKRLRIALTVITVVPASALAAYKCTTPQGVVYQDRPCEVGVQTHVDSSGDSYARKKAPTRADDVIKNLWKERTRADYIADLKMCLKDDLCDPARIQHDMEELASGEIINALGQPVRTQDMGTTRYLYWGLKVEPYGQKPKTAMFQVVAGDCPSSIYGVKNNTVCKVNVTY